MFRVTHHVPINNEALDVMVRDFRKCVPDHQPLWNCVGIIRQGENDTRIEIEVQAYDSVKKE